MVGPRTFGDERRCAKARFIRPAHGRRFCQNRAKHGTPLNHLFVLTEVDIKAVGPGVFNGWKAQLLRELYAETASRFNAGTALAARGERLDGAKTAFAQLADKAWKKQIKCHMRRQSDAYWLSFSTEAQVRHADMIAAMEEAGEPVALEVHGDKLRDCSEITIICQDHAGLFARLAGACALAGLTILDARITTTRDGLAIDALHVADRGQPGLYLRRRQAD